MTRAYGLPAWTTPDTMVLCASYSGDTEETLACYESAGLLGAKRAVVTAGGRLAEMARADDVPVIPLPGGLQPRAAVAYIIVASLEVAALCGAGPRMTSEIDVAASHTEQLVAEWGPDAAEDSLAKELARGLHGTIPLVTGAGLTTSIAYRWKTQINENAKQMCFWSELPEMDHNEIVGWEGARSQGRFAAVFLDDSDAHPRLKERMALSEQVIAPQRGRQLQARDARPDGHRAGRLAGPARGPGLDLPGRPEGSRPGPRTCPRRAQGGARRQLGLVLASSAAEERCDGLRSATLGRPPCSKGALLSS